MEKEKLGKLIRKYISDECTEEETRWIEKWYTSFEDEADILAFLSESEKEKLRSILLKRIRKNIDAHQRAQRIESKKLIRFSPAYVLSGIAALLILLAGLSWFLSGYFRSKGTHHPVATTSAYTIQNTGKNIRRILLPDSSTAWLHPNSSLSYPSSFTNPERRVSMTGEIFFKVTPDSLVPFVVYSKDLQTRVLGTSFRIRAYNSDPFTKVSVMTGKVSVKRISIPSQKKQTDRPSEAKQEIVLFPEESLLFSESLPELKKEKIVKSDEMAMWKKTQLTFSNVPVKEVLQKMNAAYGVEIRVSADKINDYLLKADFTGMNLPDALEILSLSLGLTYELDHHIITLRIPEP